MKKILFFDIDGTIIDTFDGKYELPKNTLEAFEKIIKNHYVIICTGRNINNIPPIIRKLNAHGYIASNGYYIEFEDKIVQNKVIDLDVTLELRTKLEEKSIDYIGEGREELFINNELSKDALDFIEFIKYSNLKTTNIGHLSTLNKFIIFSDSFDEIKPIIPSELKCYHLRKNNYIVSEKIINKGTAILELITQLNIDIDNTYCFGDGLNDIDMFIVCKHKIAMKNSKEELFKYASYITTEVYNDGLLNAFNHFKLI